MPYEINILGAGEVGDWLFSSGWPNTSWQQAMERANGIGGFEGIRGTVWKSRSSGIWYYGATCRKRGEKR